MKKNLLCILLVMFSVLNAEIITAPTLNIFEESLADIQQDTLVIFDVDDVLITCKDPTLQQANKEKLDRVCNQYATKVSPEEFMHLFSIALLAREVEIIDQKIYDLLDLLNQKNVQTIALTHTLTGRFGVIGRMEEWRITELDHLGIHFDHSSPFKPDESLHNLKGSMGCSPSIKNGVIFTAELEKGKVLEEAFKLLIKKPRAIIYIDDRRDNLESVENFCINNGIAFKGFHYTAIQSRPTQYVDEKLIEIQVDTLMREERWISSEEAAEAFNDEHL